ncbi:hypothetical protein BGS_0635 [Beggiatoa sp. SS]|nr:hypothetical protein BGS_0635 [Beggiatoa sp. SS]
MHHNPKCEATFLFNKPSYSLFDNLLALSILKYKQYQCLMNTSLSIAH